MVNVVRVLLLVIESVLLLFLIYKEQGIIVIYALGYQNKQRLVTTKMGSGE